ncbi:glycoside hydrolase superfamily [Gloeopeniophorella convolvens]|nr:glycoside hydrolase superfamily [Gloeopeniophorella convolvens]
MRLAAAILAGLPAALAFSPSFPYGSQKVRGVSLGGWLVLEPWITPSIFDNTGNSNIVDEWTFGQLQDRNTALQTLQNHWNTWITEADFAAIAAAGLNHVRLPIGYWAWQVGPGEPYITGQLPYLRKAVTWASNHGLKLIIDLHGAPGSQNGFDNSGHRISFPQWHSNQTNIDRTNAIMKQIANEFVPQYQTVAMIQPLNESRVQLLTKVSRFRPAGYDGQAVLSAVRQYWLDSWGNIGFPNGATTQANTVELIHDAFQPLSYWNGWERPPGFQGVAMDTHIYQMFSTDGVAQSNSQHISSACGNANDLQTFNDNELWTIVGEWTPAMTDCAKYLNGRGVGSRYDGSFSGSTRVGSCTGLTGSGSSFSSSFKTFLRQMWESQVITYEKASGWIQWAWKTESADEWSYQAGLKRHAPQQCSSEATRVAALNRISTNPTTFGSTASLEYDPPAGSFRAQVDSSPERNPPVAAGDDKVLKRFVDRESGVVFSALRKASGESVLPEEFKQIDCTPSLRLIIPQHIPTLEPTETSDLPSFTLVIPSPIEPHSPVVAPLPPPCTREEYLAAADAAPLTDRVPYFPRRCIHSLIPTSRCGTCELQLLACRIWYEHADRGTHSTLRAPRPYPAACNEAVRSIFFKLKIPFGEVDGSCVDQEMTSQELDNALRELERYKSICDVLEIELRHEISRSEDYRAELLKCTFGVAAIVAAAKGGASTLENVVPNAWSHEEVEEHTPIGAREARTQPALKKSRSGKRRSFEGQDDGAEWPICKRAGLPNHMHQLRQGGRDSSSALLLCQSCATTIQSQIGFTHSSARKGQSVAHPFDTVASTAKLHFPGSSKCGGIPFRPTASGSALRTRIKLRRALRRQPTLAEIKQSLRDDPSADLTWKDISAAFEDGEEAQSRFR